MSQKNDLVAVGRSIVDASLYMVLGTADRAGHPWTSPVYFAPAAYGDLYWVSAPETLHSRNIEVRPDVSVVVFDSSAPISTGTGVYMSATAEEVQGAQRAAGIECFSRRSVAHGGREWTLDDIEGQARLRLYRATAGEQWVLDEGDRRVPVDLRTGGPLG